jgi:Fuc2NAc and GlcNAc transferase
VQLLYELNWSLFALPIGFVSTVLLTYVLLRIELRKGVVDIPNERSSHTSPVPRGGGLAVIIVFFAFLFIAPIFGGASIDYSVWKSLLIGGAIITAIGFIDDLGHIPARWRFLTHLFAAVLSLSLLTSLPEVPLFGSSFDLGIFGYFVFVISLVWFVNLYNFMDGIDGIAGVEAITALGGGALIMSLQGQSDWLTLFGVLAACIAGFLVWNWPPAKVFMGDACSGFLGFTLGLLAIVTSTNGVMSIWSWLILFGVFVVDATTTLITRMLLGERWFEAHRSHAYQILSRRYRSHRKVTVGVLVINAVWLIPLALLSVQFPYWAAAICCAALSPLLLLAVRVGAGKREIEA